MSEESPKKNNLLLMAYKLVLISLPVAAFVVPLGWVATPYFEFFNGMAVQPKAKAQMTYGWNAKSHSEPAAKADQHDDQGNGGHEVDSHDGGHGHGAVKKADSLPSLDDGHWQSVAGTIPRGFVPHPFDPIYLDPASEMYKAVDPDTGLLKTDAEAYQLIIEAAGEKLENPVPLSRETLVRGKTLYENTCYICHGTEGVGDGPVIGAGRFPAPTSLQDAAILKYKDGAIYQVITAGKGKMAAYRGQLEPHERWMIVHYVRALQLAQNPDAN